VLEVGDTREVHHFATLLGYGASAINPYLSFATIADLLNRGRVKVDMSLEKAIYTFKKSIDKGILKIMSKIGISTLQSYQGAQIFEALGLATEVVDKCFKGTISRIEGIGFDGIAQEILERQHRAYPTKGRPIFLIRNLSIICKLLPGIMIRQLTINTQK
jgi:glutamate synthase (NADPH/NADH) large chain